MDVETEKIEFRIGGHFGRSCNVTWDGNILTVEFFDSVCLDVMAPTIEASNRKWQNFWKKVEAADVWNWDANYQVPACDGTQWSLEMCHGDRCVESTGSNAYPESFDSFLKALQNLTGCKDIR